MRWHRRAETYEGPHCTFGQDNRRVFHHRVSEIDQHVQRNEQLLKGRPWLYIPIAYTNGGRAILAMKKGPPGDRAFAEAFALWAKR
jgi:hypothetical protein